MDLPTTHPKLDRTNTADNVVPTKHADRNILPAHDLFQRRVPPVHTGLATSPKNYGAMSSEIRASVPTTASILRGFETVADLPTLHQQRTKQNLPQRSTKTSHKLVLFPENEPVSQPASVVPPSPIVEDADDYELPLPVDSGTGDRSEAERLSKETRERWGLPRVTAYCVAEGYQLDRIREFLKKEHQVLQHRLYDECLYAPYHFPLLPGPAAVGSNILHRIGAHPIVGRAKVMSSPFAKSPGGSPQLDKQLARAEDMDLGLDYGEDHFDRQSPVYQTHTLYNRAASHEALERDANVADMDYLPRDLSPSPRRQAPNPNVPTPFMGGEVFIFDYGVIVLWNFKMSEEKAVLDDLAPFRVRPMEKDDVQVESMHFQYDPEQNQPRIYNDMLTLRSGSHMIKLSISHALSQSAVLAQYEDMMDNTIETTKHIPKTLAVTGNLHMSRTEITKISGRLFKLRMNVNLVSNVLDTPEIFWSEPTLGPLYEAMRGYLEIPQRSRILNDRCKVISDLLDMLREHMNSNYMSLLNWIVIWLIVVAILVAIGEIAVKSLNHVAGRE